MRLWAMFFSVVNWRARDRCARGIHRRGKPFDHLMAADLGILETVCFLLGCKSLDSLPQGALIAITRCAH